MKGDPKAKWSIAELASHLQEGPPAVRDGYKTTKEWAKHFGVSLTKMRAVLAAAFEEGILLRDQVVCERFDGQRQPIQVYRFNVADGQPCCERSDLCKDH